MSDRLNVDWGKEFDLLSAEGSLTHALADSRRPNSAEPHDTTEHLARAKRSAGLILGGLLRAASKVAAPRTGF
jgi:hypothetical protein